MIIKEYDFYRGDEEKIHMGVALEGGGTAALYIEGVVFSHCVTHDQRLRHEIDLHVEGGSKMSKQEMDEVEAALRGDREAAESLGWRTVSQVLKTQGDLCDKPHIG